jgi:autotransporter-associated beta strand protein
LTFEGLISVEPQLHLAHYTVVRNTDGKKKIATDGTPSTTPMTNKYFQTEALSFPAMVFMKNNFAGIVIAGAILFAGSQGRGAEKYWRIDGVTTGKWTDSAWGTSSGGPFNVGWTAGDNATFNAPSTNLYVTTTAIGNITVNANTTVTNAGTLTTGGTVSTFTVADGVTLTWQGQVFSTATGTSFIKVGNGTWDMGSQSGAFPGGFTLNAGTITMSGSSANTVGAGALTINGGTFNSTGTRTFAPTSLTIGGDFTFAGTGNPAFGMPISLGAATRNITNSTTSGSRILGGIISGNTGAGLIFWGNGSGTINLTNAGNSFTGPININGAEVQFQNDGSFGAVPGSVTAGAIVIDGGRLTAADGSQNAVAYTLNSNRGIQVGSTAGTSISVKSAAGSLTYNGIIADKSSSTGTLLKQGAGKLSLGGVSTYSGNTFINNGTVQLTTGDDRLPAGTAIYLGQSASANLGVFDLNGRNQEIAGLNSVTGINTNATLKNAVTNSAAAAILTLSGSGTYAYGDGSTNNSGIITGAIGLLKTGSGIQTLGDSNTYTGNTIVSAGTLALSGTGSINNTPVIVVAASATVDASGRTDGALTLSSGQTLNGSGTVRGVLNAASGSTVASGSATDPGVLIVTSNATLNGTTVMKLNPSDETNDVLSVGGTLTYGGVLNVTNLSGTLKAGDRFKLFNASAYTGSFSATNLPVLSNGLLWDTSPLTNGVVNVVSGILPMPYITGFSLSGTNLIFSGTNGLADGTYTLLTSTNVALALTNWTAIATNTFDGSGHFNFTNGIDPNAPLQFYMLSQ